MIIKNKTVPEFLKNGGEMGRIISDFDWSNHPLDIPEKWPLSLKFAINTMLRTAFPNFIFWGKDFRCFYNDAYRPSLGKDGKHPFILGQRGERAWPEIWDTIQPLLHMVWTTGEATWSENQLIPFYRNGRIENIYWTFSYSPLMGENEKIAGILTTCTETTDAVLNLKRVEESEEQLTFALDAAELGTWDYNPETNKFTGNKRLKSWFGIGNDREIELSIAIAAIIPEDKIRVIDAINKALSGFKKGKYDITYSIKNSSSGLTRVVHVLGRAWFTEAGVAYRFNGTMQDVSEKIKAENELFHINERLRKEELRFKYVVHNAPVGMAVFRGEDNYCELANSAFLEILQRPTTDFLNKPLFEELPEIETVVAPLFEKVRKTKQPVYDTEFKVPLKRDNTIKGAYFNLIFHPLENSEESVVDIMIIANEVTEYVEARNVLDQNESQFANLVMQSPIAMAILRGTDLRIEMANHKILNHFWQRSLNEVIDKNLIDVFPELATQKYIDELQSVILTGKSVHSKESKAIVFNGDEPIEFYIDYNYLPLVELDGTISGVILTAIDVTEQFFAKQKLVGFSKELEIKVAERTDLLKNSKDRLEYSVKKLQEANAELESFAYVSSHDLQEPLRKIQMFISMFEETDKDSLTSSGKKYLTKITESASRMRVLIDDLLAFSRTDDDKSKFQSISLNRVIEQVLDDISYQIEKTSATIEVNNLPSVRAIPFQMRQVFSNLIGNALKFSAKRKCPHIKISAEVLKGKAVSDIGLNKVRDYYKINVIDNGIGFTPGMEEKIFEVFQRLHGKQEFQGTGIGLAIVKKIMHNHEGEVSAQSIEGESATFSIYLPKIT